jgi:hypothetical protein
MKLEIGGYYLICFNEQNVPVKLMYNDMEREFGLLMKFYREYPYLHDGNGGCEQRNIPKYPEKRYYWISKRRVKRKLNKKESKNLWLRGI